MSSFKENFERGEKEQLDYDDSAFYYFGLTMLSVIILPVTYYLVISPILSSGASMIYRGGSKNCKC